jgi:hypothetical protein
VREGETSRGRVIAAAAAYFGVAFAFGFVFGTLRVLLIAPAVGEIAAVCIEVPLMLLVSAVAAARLVPRFGIGSGTGERLAVGLGAFVLLQLAEVLLAGAAGPGPFGADAAAYVTGAGSAPRLIGLVAQMIFAIMPLFIPPRNKNAGS